MGLLNKTIPVYVINGFLESGKTEFISYTICQPYFQSKGKTLLLLCEEGEKEYSEELLSQTKTVVELVTEEESITPEFLTALEKKVKPERIIIEWNGMWNYKNLELPRNWSLEQQITCIDASTFQMYYSNMKSLLAEMIRKSELIMFNRCDDVREELASFKRNVKAVNPQAEIVFEDAQGEINEMFEDDLPYSLEESVLEFDDTGYGIWYLDAMDHLERYEGKTLKFLAQVLRPKGFPQNYFVPGRMAMTCCADDMTFLGYACEFPGAATLKDKEWVKVTATVTEEFFEGYNGKGPVLHAVEIVKTSAPKEEILQFM